MEKAREFQKNIYFCFIDYSKAFAEKAMAPHFGTLAWKTLWTEEPGGLPSMGSHRVGHDWSNLAAAEAAAAKAFDCVDHHKLWKILQEMGIPDHLTCLLRNLYAGQEATVRTGHGTTGWFQIGKGVRQGCILSPCLFNLYAEYIMRNAGLDEAQAGIKIDGRNINNLRYADDTTLMAESKEELKSLFMKVKEESEKAGLNPNI